MIAVHQTQKTPSDDEMPAALTVVDVGNTSLRLGVWTDEGVVDVRRIDHADWNGLSAALTDLKAGFKGGNLVAAVVACVVPDLLQQVEDVIASALALPVQIIGRDVDMPLQSVVRNPESVGVDRLCVAAAAYERVKGSCTVMDFGTAVTVDLVDDNGVFQGGAILPGLGMQMQALGIRTAALPAVTARFPEQPVGKDTAEAIQSGVCHGLVGAVRGLVEQFAARLNRWPYVVATGGDAKMIAEHCDFIDSMIPDLCLHGVGLAYLKHLNARSSDD